VGGVTVPNKVPVKRSGKLFRVTAVATTPPLGQDLLIDILANGASIFPSGGQLKLPAGVASLVFTTTFANGPASYLFQDDILTCTPTYAVLSGVVSPAQSVTVTVELSI